MIERDSELNIKRIRFWIFLGGFGIFVVVVGIVKQLIIFF